MEKKKKWWKYWPSNDETTKAATECLYQQIIIKMRKRLLAFELGVRLQFLVRIKL